MSDPLVEGLLEKGARALAGEMWPITFRTTAGSMKEQARLMVRAKFIFGCQLDAVLPGWREGISREHAVQMSDGGYHVRNSSEEVEQVYPLAVWVEHQQQHTTVYQRDVVELSSWLPVEDGGKS